MAYGANVGSNHTSKAPDQEIWPGEGTFFGLGVNIKFPTNFSRAPYTIIASGVNTLPQRVAFPFSLINSPSAQSADLPLAFNEIIPAWQLSDNIYAIKRNECKYRTRDKARRANFDFRVFRPPIVDMMRDARQRLAEIQEVKPFYTEHDINGLGKNFLVEAHRLRAIEAYEFYVRQYALLGLKNQVHQLVTASRLDDLDTLLVDASSDANWEHQRRILHDDLAMEDFASGLETLLSMLIKVAQQVERSKGKDDHRGRRIIDDYDELYAPAAKDPFVQQTWQETRATIAEVETLLSSLKAESRH